MRRAPASRQRTENRAAAQGIEKRISDQEAEKLRLERLIAEAFAGGDHQRGKALATRLERTARLLEDLYEQWEDAT